MMPQILRRYSNEVIGFLRPMSMQVSLKADSISTASMVLDNESGDIGAGDWVRITTPNGLTNVFTVRSISTDKVTGLRTVQLDHGLNLLSECVAFGEQTPSKLGGTSQTVEIGVALRKLLDFQPVQNWIIGECDSHEAQGWSFTNSSIYAAITSMMESVQGAQVVTDQSVYPWKLSVKNYPSNISMEMRRNRNISSMQTVVDKNGMFTRVYPVGKNNSDIASVNGGVKYLEKNTDLYGIIETVLTDSSIRDKGRLKKYGQTQLDLFCHPLVTITISGFDLSEATGESLDRIVIGKLCRVPMPDLGETFTERVTELTWKDAINQPEVVQVTLATVRKTVQSVIAKTAGGGAGGSKSNTEHDCELGDHEERIQEIIGSVLWTQRDGIVAATGELEVHTVGTERSLVVKSGTQLKIERDGLTTEVIDAGNVLSSINQSGEAVTISASKINLSGYVTASDLSATNASIDNLKSGVTQASVLKATSIIAVSSLYVGGLSLQASWQSYQMPDGTYIRYLGRQ